MWAPSACWQHGWVRTYVHDSFTLLAALRRWAEAFWRIHLTPQQVGVLWSVPVFLDLSNTNSITRGFEECTIKNHLCLSAFLAPRSLSEQVWFYVALGSSCSEHLVVAFTEHSGRQEESDRAMDLSVPLRCRPLRQESRVAWCDKRVSVMAALQETGRGLTLEMGETCCRRSLRVEKSREISQKVCWKVVGDEKGAGGGITGSFHAFQFFYIKFAKHRHAGEKQLNKMTEEGNGKSKYNLRGWKRMTRQ